jgi:Acetyltransferase (GNAT) domain
LKGYNKQEIKELQLFYLDFSEYDIKRLEPHHYPMVQTLFWDAFGAKVSITEIEKKYNTSILGKDVIGFIAIHIPTNTAAAYCGVFPMKCVADGEVMYIGQSGDTMTHRQHRYKGLFIKLTTLAYDVCRQEGMKFIIRQPNENAIHGVINKLGLTRADEIVRWNLKQSIKTVPLPKLCRKAGVLTSGYLSYANKVLKKYRVDDIKEFTNTLAVNYCRILRDEDYLFYKKTTDKFFIKIEEVVIWVRLTDVLLIGDFSDYNKLTVSVIKKLKRIAFLLGYNTISIDFNESLELPAALQSFIRYSSQASCILYLDEKYKGHNFLLTAADSDTW